MTLLDRLLGREAKKAVYGGILQTTYANDIPLSVYGNDAQQKAAAYLRAYKVGWFYKGGKKISGDIAGLARTLSYEDTEGDNAEEIVAPALMEPWERLDPLEQFLRLMERPNPYQTGRTLFTKTQIRIDFTGMGYMFLEGGDGGQLPTALYGISPARMWPSVNPQGRTHRLGHGQGRPRRRRAVHDRRDPAVHRAQRGRRHLDGSGRRGGGLRQRPAVQRDGEAHGRRALHRRPAGGDDVAPRARRCPRTSSSTRSGLGATWPPTPTRPARC